jgi:hypothetical protein
MIIDVPVDLCYTLLNNYENKLIDLFHLLYRYLNDFFKKNGKIEKKSYFCSP